MVPTFLGCLQQAAAKEDGQAARDNQPDGVADQIGNHLRLA